MQQRESHVTCMLCIKICVEFATPTLNTREMADHGSGWLCSEWAGGGYLNDVHVKVMVVTLGYVMLGGAFCEWCWIVKGRAQVWLSAWQHHGSFPCTHQRPPLLIQWRSTFVTAALPLLTWYLAKLRHTSQVWSSVRQDNRPITSTVATIASTLNVVAMSCLPANAAICVPRMYVWQAPQVGFCMECAGCKQQEDGCNLQNSV